MEPKRQSETVVCQLWLGLMQACAAYKYLHRTGRRRMKRSAESLRTIAAECDEGRYCAASAKAGS